MSKGRVIIVARQAGTAAAFTTVVALLRQRRGHDGVLVFAYGRARRFWSEEIDFVPIETFADAVPILSQDPPEALLTGTSLSVADDGRWWSWAGARGVPSVGFVDQWVNYWQRFSSGPERRLDTTPDVIAVVDDRARDRLLGFGCTAPVVVTGTPAIDLLSRPSTEDVASLRTRLLTKPDAVVVLFVSEPDAATCHASPGSTQSRAALEVLLDMLPSVALDAGSTVEVVVRPHPVEIERGERLSLPETTAVPVRAAWEDRATMLRAADVVVGLHSIMLYEAAVLGIPAISLSLTSAARHDVSHDRAGIVVAHDRAELGKALHAGLVSVSETSERPLPRPGAATVEFLERLELA